MTGNYLIMGIKTRVYNLGHTSELIAIGDYLYLQPLEGIHNIHWFHSYARFSLLSLYYSAATPSLFCRFTTNVDLLL